MIFARLNFELHSGALKDWCLVVEEGHRFAQDVQLRALLTEARKFCRKVVLVTTGWRVCEGIAKVFKPRPWETAKFVRVNYGYITHSTRFRGRDGLPNLP